MELLYSRVCLMERIAKNYFHYTSSSHSPFKWSNMAALCVCPGAPVPCSVSGNTVSCVSWGRSVNQLHTLFITHWFCPHHTSPHGQVVFCHNVRTHVHGSGDERSGSITLECSKLKSPASSHLMIAPCPQMSPHIRSQYKTNIQIVTPSDTKKMAGFCSISGSHFTFNLNVLCSIVPFPSPQWSQGAICPPLKPWITKASWFESRWIT